MAMNWVYYGLGSALCFAVMVLIYKKLLLLNINPLVLNMFIFGITFLGFIIWVKATKTSIDVNTIIIVLLVLAAICSLLGNFLDVQAVKNAPNPGYASALKATQIVLITIIAPLLFKSSLTLPKLFGVILILIGIAIISVF